MLVGIYLGAMSILEPSGGKHRLVTSFLHRPLAAAVCTVLGLLLVVHLGWSLSYGVAQGKRYRSEREVAAQLLVRYRSEPAPLLSTYLFEPGGEFVKRWAPVLQANHWSVFSAEP